MTKKISVLGGAGMTSAIITALSMADFDVFSPNDKSVGFQRHIQEVDDE